MNRYDTLPKTYDPKVVEPKWYDFWMEKGYFAAGNAEDLLREDPGKEKMYSITIPPPNITG